MSDLTVSITAAVKTAIESHALRERPAECCGLLSGTDSAIVAAHPLRNEAGRSESRYFASPVDLFAAMRRIRNRGHQMLGIYHSHPRTPAYPSPTDVESAFYPEAVYFIIALAPVIDLRAFRINEARIRSVAISVID